MCLLKENRIRDHEVSARIISPIDYGPYFAGEKRALEHLSRKVAHACEKVGFFHIFNHGVPDVLIERAFAASRRFFALPLEQKLAIKLNCDHVGYLPIDASVQGGKIVRKAVIPNHNESFFVSHDREACHPDVLAQEPPCGTNQWPVGISGLRGDMMPYFAAVEAMCQRMLPSFAVALGMPTDFFAPYFADMPHASLRFLHYPPQHSCPDKVFGQGPHTDNCFMTALALSDVPGLVVRLPSGKWFSLPVIRGTFLVNSGNIMRRWSNDRFLSAPHAVINTSGIDRYSIAYFHSPHLDRNIECLSTCVGPDNPARYSAAVHRDLAV
jgi:isopenicillin N synthase-like dioxygenase